MHTGLADVACMHTSLADVACTHTGQTDVMHANQYNTARLAHEANEATCMHSRTADDPGVIP